MTINVSIKKHLLASISTLAFGVLVSNGAWAAQVYIDNGDNTALSSGDEVIFIGSNTTGTATVANGVTIGMAEASNPNAGTLSFTSTGGTGGSSDDIATSISRIGILNITLSGSGTETFSGAVNAITTNISGSGTVSFGGAVKGTTMNFTSNSNNTTTVSGSGGIGATGVRFTNVNFDSGTVNIANNIFSDSINISSSALVNLTAAKTFEGAVVQTGTSTFNLGLNTLTLSNANAASGNYTQSSTNTLKVSLEGSSSGKIVTSGAVDMGNGNLNLSVGSISNGAMFDVVTGGSVTGTSLTITDNSDAYNFTASSNASTITITAQSDPSGGTATQQSTNNINTVNQSLNNVGKVITDHIADKGVSTPDSSSNSPTGPASYQLPDTALNSESALKALCKVLADSRAIFPAFLTADEKAAIFMNELFSGLSPEAKDWSMNWLVTQISNGNSLESIFIDAMKAVVSTTNPMYADYRSYKILNTGMLNVLAKYKVPLPTEIKNLASIKSASSGVSTGSFASQYNIWGQILGTKADQGWRDSVAGYKSNTGGFVIGMDTRLSQPLMVGSAISYARTFLKATNNENQVDSYGINAFASYDVGRINYQGLGSLTFNSFDSNRLTSDGTIATAKFNGQQYSAKGTVSYTLPLKTKLQVSPFVSGQYTLVVQDKYDEIGSTSNMHVETDNSNIFETGLGVNLAYQIQHNGTAYTPRLSATWHYDPILDAVSTTSNFSTNTALITKSTGQTPAKHSYNLGAGLDILSQNNLTFSADYSLDLKEHFTAHTGMLKAKLDF